MRPTFRVAVTILAAQAHLVAITYYGAKVPYRKTGLNASFLTTGHQDQPLSLSEHGQEESSSLCSVKTVCPKLRSIKSRNLLTEPLIHPAGCKLALLPIREANGMPAATTSTWYEICSAAASDVLTSVYRECVLPYSPASGGYRSTGTSTNI